MTRMWWWNTKVKCGICGNDDGKYKCPKCRAPYCSVKCCKEQKVKFPAAAAPNDKSPTSTLDRSNPLFPDGKSTMNTPSLSQYLPSDVLSADPPENSIRRRRMLDDDDDSDCEEGFRITSDMMSRLDNLSWLKKELSDGGLRQILCDIDSAGTEEEESEHRRQDNHENGKRGRMDADPREVALERSKILNPKFSRFVDRLLLEAGGTGVGPSARFTTRQW